MLKRILVSAVVATLVSVAWCAAQAQEAKSLVTVTFSGYDELKKDIAMVGQLGGNPQLADGLEMMLQGPTQGKGLEGLDKSKPWGFVVQTKGDDFPMFGFVPVTDLKKLVDLLNGVGANIQDKGDGTYELRPAGQSITVKGQGGWAFIVPKPESLKDLPADPLAIVGDIYKKYDVAVRASVKNVPEQYKTMFLEQMKMMVQMTGRRMPNESDEQFAIRSNMTRQSVQQVTTLAKELDELTVGLAIDQQTKTAYLDVSITAIPGTKIAQQMATLADAKTNFAGFDQPGAAVTGVWSGKYSDTDVAQTKTALKSFREMAIKEVGNQGLSDSELALAKQILGDLFDVFDKTLDTKKIDGGMTATLAPGAATVALGGAMVDVPKIEKILKQVVAEAAKEEPEAAKLFKFDAETYSGVRFHVVTIPLPTGSNEMDKLAKQVGNPAEIVIGAGDNVLYLAAGRDAGKLLKKIIDKSKAEPNKAVPPSRIVIAAAPIAKFVAAVAENEPMVQQIATRLAGIFEQSSGKDHVTIVTKAIPNGATVRLELEEGLLKAIPMMAMPGM